MPARGVSRSSKRAAGVSSRASLASKTSIERALRDSEQRLRAIVETAVDAIITADERGIIESANPASERIFGYAPSELFGQSVNILMPAPVSNHHDSYVQRYLTTGKRRIIGVGREVVGLRKDGTRFPIHLSISEVRLNRGRMFTAIIHDITERRRLERDILDVGAREQRRIGRDLHDGVCQNLVGIALGMSVLTKRLVTRCPEGAAEAERLANLVRETASHARSLSHGLAPLDVTVGGLASALSKLSQQISQTSGIKCHLDYDASLRPEDPVTANHLYRIVQEAVSNAIRHGKATEIRVSLLDDDGDARLTISDNGRGFARSRGDEGLGLQTMAYRARVIGGALRVESRLGRGTAVSCVFHPNCTT